MDSIFSRVFSYRERENHSPIENFLTEILAFCLENDKSFCNDVLKTFGLPNPSNNISISTQSAYEGYGRPDIEIAYDDNILLIENKVEATERVNQLADYALILSIFKKSYRNKHVVFLTKYYEKKEILNKSVHLHIHRWYEIFELINYEKHKDTTLQFKQFLKDLDMEAVKNFTIQDLLGMQTISKTITKMNEILEQIKPEFAHHFGGFSKDSSRSTRLVNDCYINYVVLTYNGILYYLDIGFFWGDWIDENEIPNFGLCIEVPIKKSEESDLSKILDKELGRKQWAMDEFNGYFRYKSLTPITDFITQSDDNILIMVKFIKNNLKTIISLGTKYPKLFKK